MTGDLRMPTKGDYQYIAARANRNMLGGPPKATHHITADALHDDGKRVITLAGVSNYLVNKGYEPHVVIDPFTGATFQLLDALSSGYALENNGIATNRQGSVNLQVEWFFTPGTVWNGKRYAQLTDTPMLGLSDFLPWCDSWGIPRIAPLRPGDRNQYTWRDVAGHFGHFNAPLNSHVDPIVDVADILLKVPATPHQTGGTDMDVTYVFGNEDWILSTSARYWGRIPHSDFLEGMKPGGLIGLSDTPGRKTPMSADFHAGARQLAQSCGFRGELG